MESQGGNSQDHSTLPGITMKDGVHIVGSVNIQVVLGYSFGMEVKGEWKELSSFFGLSLFWSFRNLGHYDFKNKYHKILLV